MTNLRTQDVVSSIPSYRLIPLTQGQFAIVDVEDFDSLNQWKWHARWDKSSQSYYAQRNISMLGGKQKLVSMHSVILSPTKGKLTDHISGNTLDNRRSNLREATTRQNAANRRRRCTNKSGYPGVYLYTRPSGNQVYSVSIGFDRKQHHLGYRSTFKEAVALRKAAEAEHFGKYTRQSS